MLDYFDRVRERTMRVVACVPPDRVVNARGVEDLLAWTRR